MNHRPCPYADPACLFGSCAQCRADLEKPTAPFGLPPFLNEQSVTIIDPSEEWPALLFGVREKTNLAWYFENVPLDRRVPYARSTEAELCREIEHSIDQGECTEQFWDIAEIAPLPGWEYRMLCDMAKERQRAGRAQ